MGKPSFIALLAIASHLAASSTSCTPAQAPAARRGTLQVSSSVEFAGAAHAAHGHGHAGQGRREVRPHEMPPCHATWLVAPCRCGCGGGIPGVEPPRQALGKLLLAPGAPLWLAWSAPRTDLPAQAPFDAPSALPEHVPI